MQLNEVKHGAAGECGIEGSAMLVDSAADHSRLWRTNGHVYHSTKSDA
jgi:hypothetical protein